jgi:hypothetical protein
MYYKPNNWKFSQQGAADASTFMLRRKFDTITNNTAVFRRVYGNQVASAMSYGIANSVYTYKDKIGYPLPKRPRIRPESTPTCCTDTHIAGGMRVNDVPV